MERITSEHWRNFDPWETCGQDNYCRRNCHDLGGCANGCKVPKIYGQLARYEDIGLSPDEVKALKYFKEYFDELYGKGLEIANWHLNDELEPFDIFYNSAVEGGGD